MFELLAQTPPSSDLPTEWAVWIIIGLLSFIGFIFTALKWLIGLASDKTDKIVEEFKCMHKEGVNELKTIRESQIKTEKSIDTLDSNIKENKYTLNKINEKISI